MSIYQDESDVSLVAKFRAGEDEAADVLLRRYAGTVRCHALEFYIQGGDFDDLIQEGTIGLLGAIRRYDESRAMSFSSFAALCIKSKLKNAIESASRKKNQPLNQSIPFEAPLFDNPAQNLVSTSGDPVEYVIGDEGFQELLQAMSALLSSFELRVLKLYLSGLSYAEIARITSKPRKSIDNAICRIRRKLAEHVAQQGIIGE